MLEIVGVTDDIKLGSWDALARAECSCDRFRAFGAEGGALPLVRTAGTGEGIRGVLYCPAIDFGRYEFDT